MKYKDTDQTAKCAVWSATLLFANTSQVFSLCSPFDPCNIRKTNPASGVPIPLYQMAIFTCSLEKSFVHWIEIVCVVGVLETVQMKISKFMASSKSMLILSYLSKHCMRWFLSLKANKVCVSASMKKW